MKSKLSCIIAFLLIALNSHAKNLGEEIHPHWVGLFPGDILEEYDYAGRKKNTGNWAVPVYANPDSNSESIGSINIEFVADKGLSAEFIEKNSSTGVAIQPHLFDSDYGYGPYFHLTIIEEKNNLYKVQLTENERYWADFEAEFGASNIAVMYLNHPYYSSLFDWENDDGDIEAIYVEHADKHSLVVRSEQPIDMGCGEENLRFGPYKTKLIPRSKWINPTGESRFNVRYTRGC